MGTSEDNLATTPEATGRLVLGLADGESIELAVGGDQGQRIRVELLRAGRRRVRLCVVAPLGVAIARQSAEGARWPQAGDFAVLVQHHERWRSANGGPCVRVLAVEGDAATVEMPVMDAAGSLQRRRVGIGHLRRPSESVVRDAIVRFESVRAGRAR